MKKLYIIVFLAGLCSGKAQNAPVKLIDSLRLEFGRAAHDTTRAAIYQNFTELLYLSKPDTVIPLCLKSIELCDRNLNRANDQERHTFLLIKSAALNNMGYMYENLGNIPLALDHYHKGLKIQEEIGDKKGLAQSLNNIGYVYQVERDAVRALEYYKKSLAIREEIGDQKGIAESFNNLGFLYRNFGDPACKSSMKDACMRDGMNKALEFYLKSLKIKESISDSIGISISFNNIGTIYRMLKEYDKAFDYFNKSLSIRERLNDRQGQAIALNNLGVVLYWKNDFSGAEQYSLRSLAMAQQLGYPELIKRAAEALKDIYTKKGDYKKVVDMFTLYIRMRDSVNSQASHKAAVKQQLQYEYEKKTTADSLRISQERKVIEVQLAHERTQRYALAGGLLLVLVFAAFMFNRFKITKKQKEIIEKQKHLVEEKQKEIVDSITYAQRIQKALLTSGETLAAQLPDHFIYFSPKDIVSGDFYWASMASNGSFALIVADSTGHGVPGAFMSLLNISFLNEAVIGHRHSDPAAILGHVRKRIIQSLASDGSAEGGKDGMDGSLVCFDLANGTMQYAAANNPVWLVRDGKLQQLGYDKMPVGRHDKDTVPFSCHTVSLQKGDMVYLFTDGFADQFGGPQGKKYKYRQMEELFAGISPLSLPDQKARIDEAFRAWRGNLEQVDDICIIGVRI